MTEVNKGDLDSGMNSIAKIYPTNTLGGIAKPIKKTKKYVNSKECEKRSTPDAKYCKSPPIMTTGFLPIRSASGGRIKLERTTAEKKIEPIRPNLK